MFEIQKYTRDATLLYDTDSCRVVGVKKPRHGWILLESNFDNFFEQMYYIKWVMGICDLVEIIKYDNYKDAYLDMFIESITA